MWTPLQGRSPITLTDEQWRELCQRRDAGIAAAAASIHPQAANLVEGISRRELDALIVDGQAARNRMVEANLGLVRSIVSSVAHDHGHRDDYIQEGMVALVRSVDRYDPDSGAFAPFAAPRIRGAVHNMLSTGGGEDHVNSHQARMRELVRSRTRRLEAAGLPATRSDVAKALGRTEEWVARYASYRPPLDLSVEVTDSTNQERFDAMDTVPLSRYLRMLPKEERVALRLVLGFAGREHTLEEAGKVMGVSISTVSRRVASGHQHLEELAARFDQQLFEGKAAGRPNRASDRVPEDHAPALRRPSGGGRARSIQL